MFTLRTKIAILRALVTKKSPYYIQFFITNRCNMACKYCHIVQSNCDVEEASLESITRIADHIRDIGGGIVLLTGGEPFLREDIADIVRIFTVRGLDVRLQTGGNIVATDEKLRMCYDAGARDINISLDSLVEKTQDYINSVPGSWHNAIECIGRVSRIFSRESAICGIGCVLSRMNFREIPAILEFVTSIGWYLSLVPVHINQKGGSGRFRGNDAQFAFKQEDSRELEALIETLMDMKRRGYALFDSNRYLRGCLGFIKSGHPDWRHNGVCDSPNLYFAIRPNGDFTTCCDYIVKDTYNVADESFVAKYNSGIIKKLSKDIVANCPGCQYGSYPEVNISVRGLKVVWQRARVALFDKKNAMQSLKSEELFSMIESVRKRYPSEYRI